MNVLQDVQNLLQALNDPDCPADHLLVLADAIEESGQNVLASSWRMVYRSGRRPTLHTPEFYDLRTDLALKGWKWRYGCSCDPIRIYLQPGLCVGFAGTEVCHSNERYVVGREAFFSIRGWPQAQLGCNFVALPTRQEAFTALAIALQHIFYYNPT